MSNSSTLHFHGCTHFRQRIICATLTGRKIKIDQIRDEDEQPGLNQVEASFLRFIDRISNGCQIEINETGTVLRYIPGFLVGGAIEHDCGHFRSIGYFLEAAVALAPFGKKPLVATFTGVTNDEIDTSVDNFRAVTIPLLKNFGLDEGLELKIKKRGAKPNGGGEVIFRCPLVRQLQTIHLVDAGLIKRIRGVAYSTRMSPHTSNRMVDAARGFFNNFIPDVYIYSDHYKGKEAGNSPGFALSVVAESTSGVFIGAEAASVSGSSPEDIAVQASQALLEEISKGGCVDSAHQSLVFLLMALSPEDVSKVRVGKLTPYSIQFLRHLRDFFGITFKIRADNTTKTVLLSCLGLGYKNLAKKVT